MKFLSGLEELQIGGVADGKGGWRLSGQLHWVTNLQTRGFQAVTVVQPVGGGEPFIASIGSGLAGVSRSADLALMAMQGSAKPVGVAFVPGGDRTGRAQPDWRGHVSEIILAFRVPAAFTAPSAADANALVI